MPRGGPGRRGEPRRGTRGKGNQKVAAEVLARRWRAIKVRKVGTPHMATASHMFLALHNSWVFVACFPQGRAAGGAQVCNATPPAAWRALGRHGSLVSWGRWRQRALSPSPSLWQRVSSLAFAILLPSTCCPISLTYPASTPRGREGNGVTAGRGRLGAWGRGDWGEEEGQAGRREQRIVPVAACPSEMRVPRRVSQSVCGGVP